MSDSKEPLIRDLILVALIAFLLGCLTTRCAAPTKAVRAPADCQAEPDAFRCQVWQPEVELELDDFEDAFKQWLKQRGEV